MTPEEQETAQSLRDNSTTGKPQVSRKRRGPSLVWFVPLVALLLGGWLVYQSWVSSGPLVTISFKTASGIEAGVTKIKYREVSIGEVETIKISDDFKQVLVAARLDRQAAPYLNDSTKFWIERPRVGAAGISGLGTLFSGAHIGFEAAEGEEDRRSFEGLEEPPQITAGSDGMRVTLRADSVGSLVAGSPIYFKSFKVGTIDNVQLDDEFNNVLIDAFIDAPYDQLVHQNSRFWNVSGISAEINSEGIAVNFQSLESLLIGGIEFDSPLTGDSTAAGSDQVFRLYESFQDVGVRSFAHKVFYIVNFDQSIRGLNVDAPVEYRGLKIGRVVNISSRYNLDQGEILLPVLIEVEPQRLGIEVGKDGASDKAEEEIIDLGLRAKLEIANLITGQLYVSLDFYDDPAVTNLPDFEGFKQIPTISTDLNRIAANIDEALEKINRLEIEKLVNSMIETVEGVKEAVASVRDTSNSAKALVDTSDEAVEKVLTSIQKTLQRGQELIKSGETMFEKGQTVMQSLEEGSATRYQLDQTLKELQAAARSLKTLTETIEKNPNSLIFGKQQ